MAFSDYIRKRLVDLLADRRIVVWYDAEGDFVDFVSAFSAPNCEVLSATESILKVRRRADEVYRQLNESAKSEESKRNLLIYYPRSRGKNEEEKMHDPFEVYALAGVAFGDTEDQKLESLARQAMPKKAEEITRFFQEGSPNIALLDSLDKTQRYPLLHQALRTESPTEIVALVLGEPSKAKSVEELPGCPEELMRLLEPTIGYQLRSRLKAWKSICEDLASYVLFSEFVLDLPEAAPDSLSAVPRADESAMETVFAICDHMRSDSNLVETYLALAESIEQSLHLPELCEDVREFGLRDTFAFEERKFLGRLCDAAQENNNEGSEPYWKAASVRFGVGTPSARCSGLSPNERLTFNQDPFRNDWSLQT
jgi:hypothetical protein